MALQLAQNFEVTNNTQRRLTDPQLTTDNNQLTHTQTAPTADKSKKGDGERKNAYISTGYIVKQHIYPVHKFITRSEDLLYDNSPEGNSICKTYLRSLDLDDSSDEIKCRRLWENARQSIPLSLNTQRNNTSKAIRDTTFVSKCHDEIIFDVTKTHTCLSNKQSCSIYSPTKSKKRI